MKERFTRLREGEGSIAGKVFSRDEINRRLDAREAMDPAGFLARLWAHFGEPARIDDGFEYELRDRETGLAFSAYSGPSGPSYGGDPRRAKALRPVIVAFERMLDATTPVDCELVFDADIEYGGGEVAIGWRDGRAFRESRDRRTPPASATSYEQCVAIAREHEGGYGAIAGWQTCLDAVLPSPPEEVTWQRRAYEQPLGFSIEAGVPSMIYLGPSEAPEHVPVAAITLRLSKAAKLWLASYERWRETKPKTRNARR